MKESTFKDEEQLITEAVDILVRELGPVEAGRFLSLQRRDRVESVTRHRKWQSTLDKDRFFEKVFGEDDA